jgi:hypothetical protein
MLRKTGYTLFPLPSSDKSTIAAPVVVATALRPGLHSQPPEKPIEQDRRRDACRSDRREPSR